MRRAALSMLLVAVSAGIATAQESPSSVGTWTLNLAKSDFGKQPAPKSATLELLHDTEARSMESRILSWGAPR
jgi:hypothetical protein